jgi:hypothetical protein
MSAGKSDSLDRLVGAVCRLHVACNDERGNWAARAGAIHIQTKGDATMDWQANDLFRPPRCSAGAGFVRVCGIKIRATDRAEWVGSWCWDAWRVAGADVVRLLTHPRFVRGFSADGGTTDLWDAWHAAIAGPNAAGQTPAANKEASHE